MNNASLTSTNDLKLKIEWRSNHAGLDDEPRAVLKLQTLDGKVVASLSVLKQDLLESVFNKIACYPYMSPKGTIAVTSDEIGLPSLPVPHLDIDVLIAESISPDMLYNEKNVDAMLVELLNRLQKSVALVQQTIATQATS